MTHFEAMTATIEEEIRVEARFDFSARMRVQGADYDYRPLTLSPPLAANFRPYFAKPEGEA